MMMGPSAANQAVLVLGATFLPWVEGFAFQTPQLELPTLPNLFNPLSPTTRTFSYTHLECNGQLWQATSGNNEVSVVIDPLASQLDFGIPWVRCVAMPATSCEVGKCPPHSWQQLTGSYFTTTHGIPDDVGLPSEQAILVRGRNDRLDLRCKPLALPADDGTR